MCMFLWNTVGQKGGKHYNIFRYFSSFHAEKKMSKLQIIKVARFSLIPFVELF